MLKEFKEFAMRGNVIDLAVGIIIGAAFGRIVTSLVNDIIMPPIGLLMGNVDFSNLFVNLDMNQSFASVAEAEAAGAPIIKYGLFINTVLDFVIVAFAIFLGVVADQCAAGDEDVAVDDRAADPGMTADPHARHQDALLDRAEAVDAPAGGGLVHPHPALTRRLSPARRRR